MCDIPGEVQTRGDKKETGGELVSPRRIHWSRNQAVVASSLSDQSFYSSTRILPDDCVQMCDLA